MAGRATHKKTTCNQLECMAVCRFESIPRLDPGEADNQSPMKQDNRDHWTLFSGNLQHLFQGAPTPPPTTPNLFCFISRSLSWNDNFPKQFLSSSKNLSEHLLEEVNWLFCRRLSALSFPPPHFLLLPDPIHPGECCKFLLRPFTRQSNHC